jgi:AbrB family looped-hinge helix DNA binding protein
MEAAKITFKGQVTIPKKVRIALGIQAGDSVIFSVDGKQAVLKPLRKRSLLDFFGVMPANRTYPGSEAIRLEIHKKLSGKTIEKRKR